MDNPVNEVDPGGKMCFYFSNEALDDLALDYLVWGLELGIVALFLAIIDPFAAAIIGALALMLTFEGGVFLWYFDKYYPNGAYICF
jgi:hypothetical protein